MNLQRLITTMLCSLLCGHALAQDIDSQLSNMATNLAAQINSQGKKKVAVLDFTDLQGGSTELGKYIAEQLTVNLVMGKKDFSVLDRANLKSILAEHKLTSEGLVDPENAKKLGMFAGVDALVLGTIIPKGQNISLNAKIITTDTAEIVGAARTEFKSDDTVQQLAAKPVKPEDIAGASQPQLTGISQKFGNLTVVFDRLRSVNGRSIEVDLTFQNTSDKTPIAVAMYHDVCYVQPCFLVSSLVAGDGTQYVSQDSGLRGIAATRWSPKPLTEIDPSGEIKASVIFEPRGTISDSVTTFTLQAELVVNHNYNASDYDNLQLDQNSLTPYCKLEYLNFDIPVKQPR
jgi:TolB-like protein